MYDGKKETMTLYCNNDGPLQAARHHSQALYCASPADGWSNRGHELGGTTVLTPLLHRGTGMLVQLARTRPVCHQQLPALGYKVLSFPTHSHLLSSLGHWTPGSESTCCRGVHGSPIPCLQQLSQGTLPYPHTDKLVTLRCPGIHRRRSGLAFHQ